MDDVVTRNDVLKLTLSFPNNKLTPRRSGSNKYPQMIFRIKIKKNCKNLYSVHPSFTIQDGGVRTCKPDGTVSIYWATT